MLLLQLKSPTNGIAFASNRNGKDVLIIDCTDEAKKEWSIELSGVQASVPSEGKVVCANDTIGTGKEEEWLLGRGRERVLAESAVVFVDSVMFINYSVFLF